MPTTDLPLRIKRASQLTGEFTLRSGATSATYFDKYRFEADPDLLRDLAEAMIALLPPDTEVLAGMEMGGIPLVTALSLRTGLPAAFVRKEAKTYGTCRYAEGADLAERRFVLVEDVVSSGGAILDALVKMRADGLWPTRAICVIDRGTGQETLAAEGLDLLGLFTYDEIANAANRSA
ncbi:orotate phosphoribosyltransferase [bacterium]|nr:MAG: orotate phosphoribosyltransferase [bacterium]